MDNYFTHISFYLLYAAAIVAIVPYPLPYRPQRIVASIPHRDEIDK